METLSGWRPHTEVPTNIPVTAIIAVRDEDGEANLLTGVFTYTRDRNAWWNEIDGTPVKDAVFWWFPEEELLAALPGAKVQP